MQCTKKVGGMEMGAPSNNPHHKHSHHEHWQFSFQDGMTPLYNACMKGHLEMVILLIDKGADLKAVTNVCFWI